MFCKEYIELFYDTYVTFGVVISGIFVSVWDGMVLKRYSTENTQEFREYNFETVKFE